ncbi:MAG: regulatory protein RecX [Myxococcales bacterium]|nr:regulatory protein RecX [Myxococcales bacterium]MCB9648310.1 regulatory protein RecX [Deltaproteobacteria bacterium]
MRRPRRRAGAPDPAAQNPLDTLARILSRRAHTRVELVRKLRQRGFTPDVINETLARAAELHLLEPEEDLAVRYARELAQKAGATPRKVSAKLAEKGFDRGQAKAAVDAAFESWDPRGSAWALVEREGDPARAARRLARAGFPAEVVRWAVEKITQSHEDGR